MKNKLKNSNNYTWDLSSLTKIDFVKTRKLISSRHDKFINEWSERSDWLKKPIVLKKVLDEFENLHRYSTNGAEELYYYWLRSQVEENNTEIKAKFNQIVNFSVDLNNKLQFFELRLARIDKKTQAKFIHDKNLKPYKHFLEKLFSQADYLLSEPEEKIMRLKEQSSYSNWVKMTSEFLSSEKAEVLLENGKKAKKSFSEILSLITSQHKKVRDSSAQAFNEILKKNIKIGENELNSILANKQVDDELRRLKRPDLARHLSDDISSSVIDSMLKVVSNNFSVSQRYYKLKAKILKVKKLKYHERNLPIAKTNINYSYDHSKKLVSRVLKNLDLEFFNIFNNFVKNSQIDVYPRVAKSSGAFCAAESVSQPTFIMLNHVNNLNDVLTLAHEVGHGINNEMMRAKQNGLNFGVTVATAEVASTFFEDFVLKEILEEADKETRFEIMMEKLNQDINTIFRQVALYLFETELHQVFRVKGYLNAQEIGELFQKHMTAYMGPAVDKSKGSENWWLYWSHIRSFFYVYSYASGLLISKSLQNQVALDKGFIKNIKYFLATGVSDSPQNIFKNLGIDINDRVFWKKGIKEIEILLSETERLAQELKKIN